MRRRTTLLGLVLLGAATVSLPGAYATRSADPGVTSTTILIGGTVPLTGPAAAFASVAPGADAYFKYVNARGGVHGRKIKYKYVDDGFDASRTVEETRKLVQQDRVFAIFNSIGTEHSIAVRPYLNQVRVPHLFLGTGASEIGGGFRRYPWSMGYLPSFFGEGVIYGRYIARERRRARIGILFENTDYGKDLTNGLRKGLGRSANRIVATQSYEVTDSDPNSQVARLESARADTFMVFATPKFAIQSFIAAYKLRWAPRIFVSSVSIEPTIMRIARLNTNSRTTEGSTSMGYLKDPTSPMWARDPGVALYREIMRRHRPGGKVDDVYHFYGMAVAFTMVDALRRAGRNLTRQGLLRAATHLRETDNPFLLPGVAVRTAPDNYYPIAKVKLFRYRKGRWVPFGPLLSARG